MGLIGSIPSLTLIGTQGDVKDRDLFCRSCRQNRRPDFGIGVFWLFLVQQIGILSLPIVTYQTIIVVYLWREQLRSNTPPKFSAETLTKKGKIPN
jgi:hypothetical protein